MHDGAPNVGGDLAGVDVTLELPHQSLLTLAGATTDTDRHGSANGYVAEIEHNSADLAGRAYLREQQVDFGLGQQSAMESGTRKFGAEGEYRLTETLSARLDAFQQTYLVADSERKVAESQLVYEQGALQLEGGLRAIREQTAIGINREANQLTLAGSQTLDGGRMRLASVADIDLGGGGDDIDYPRAVERRGISRRRGRKPLRRAGVHVQRHPRHAELARRRQSATLDGLERERVRGPSSGRKRRALVRNDRFGPGIAVQRLWRVDFGMDRVKTLESDPIAEVPPALTYNPNVPLTSGSVDDDFTAAFAGFGYREGDWD